MTVIIGFQDRNGGTCIAADCRITWSTGVIEDNLLKLCFFPSGVALAFATSDICAIKPILRRLHRGLEGRSKSYYSNGSSCRLQKSLCRFFRRAENRTCADTEFLIALVDNATSNYNKLISCRLSSGKFKICSVKPTELYIGGSAINEEGYSEMYNILRKIPRYDRPVLSLSQRCALLQDEYSRVRNDGGHTWRTIGELICTAYTCHDIFCTSNFEMNTVVSNGHYHKITLKHDAITSAPILKNETTGQLVQLKNLNEFISPTRQPTERIFKT